MNDWMITTLRIWNTIQSTFGLPKKISALTYIVHMNNFVPFKFDMGLKTWVKFGLTNLLQCLDNGVKSFAQISNQFKLPNIFFLVLTVKGFFLP